MSIKKNYLLISGIRFTYKFIIPYIKTKQNIFFGFFEILAKVLMTLINWLLKPKCMIKYMYIFFEVFFVV
jgi:hypothetical protein